MSKAYFKPVCTLIVALGLGVLYNPFTANAQSIFASCEEDIAKFARPSPRDMAG